MKHEIHFPRFTRRLLAAACCLATSALVTLSPALASDAAEPATGTIEPELPFEEPRGRLDLAAAQQAARLNHPLLRAGRRKADARAAEIRQAGLLPNPTFELELENIAGSGNRQGVEQAETTVWLSQPVPIGGKRDRRRHIAGLRHELALLDNAASRTALLAQTAKAFTTLLVAQERLGLAAELEAVAKRGVEVLTNQAAAGAVPSASRVKAEVALLEVRLELAQANRDLAASRLALAATWGSTDPRFDAAVGDLRDGVTDPPPLAALTRDIETNPELASRATAVAQYEEKLSLAQALWLPDPTVRVAGRHFSSGDDAALVLSVSMPIPIFDRNRGNELAAAHEVDQARAQLAATELVVRTALAQRHQDLRGAFEQVRMLRDSAVPAARLAFDETTDAFRAGVLSYLDVLDAQRSLFDLRARELDALSAYHEARADIARLLGRGLEDEETTR